jgi:hypothetical protein
VVRVACLDRRRTMHLGVAIETWLLHMGPHEAPARSDGLWLIFEPVLPPKPWMPNGDQ